MPCRSPWSAARSCRSSPRASPTAWAPRSPGHGRSRWPALRRWRVLLDDPTILAGLRFMLERGKQLLEPAGAAALAAVLAGRIPIRGRGARGGHPLGRQRGDRPARRRCSMPRARCPGPRRDGGATGRRGRGRPCSAARRAATDRGGETAAGRRATAAPGRADGAQQPAAARRAAGRAAATTSPRRPEPSTAAGASARIDPPARRGQLRPAVPGVGRDASARRSTWGRSSSARSARSPSQAGSSRSPRSTARSTRPPRS